MRATVLALLLVVPLALGTTPKECSWGESYWCSSLKVAKSCGAVRHCTDTIWTNVDVEVKETEVCQFCEGIIGDVRKFWEAKETQDAIKQYVDMACKTIPNSAISSDCQEIFTSFMPEIMQLVDSELDPQRVCSIIGLCSGFEDKVNHPDVVPKDVAAPNIPILLSGAPVVIPLSGEAEFKGDICTDCKNLVSDIKSKLTSDVTEKEVEAQLKQAICSMLGGLQSECNNLVEQYIPELMDMLTSSIDPAAVCGAVQACPGQDKNILARLRLMKSELYKVASSNANDEECDICKLAMTELASYLDNADDQKAVEDFIKQNLCSRLGSMEKECDTTVDQYGPILFSLIKEELSNPEGLCKSIGMCAASKKDISRQNTKKVKSPSTQCVICEFAMKEIETLLEDNKTESAVIGAVEKVCAILPGTLSKECSDFIEVYGPAIVELLVQELSPEDICTFIGLCQAKTQQKPVMDKPYCGACETVIMYVDSLITQNSTEQEIEKVLDKVCNFLPDTLKDQCDELVKMYGPQIAQLLAKGLDPMKVCTEISLCSAAKEPKKDTTLKFVPMQEIVPAKAHLLGEKECTYGPAYWCKDRETAIKCNAVPHCERHVWNN